MTKGVLLLAAVVLLSGAAALPPYVPTDGLAHVGPDLSCALPQEYGYDGTAAGSPHGYHRYASGIALAAADGCVTPPDPSVATCVAGAAQSDVLSGLGQILSLTVGGILAGAGTATSGASDLYQRDCGGLLDTGTDGEPEFGVGSAALIVRTGPGVEPQVLGYGGVPGGDGATACVGAPATAHHANDTTVFVEDLAMGGAVGFTVVADWARPAGLSFDNTDQNARPGIAHCGDGVVEPCVLDAHAGLVSDVAFRGGASAVLADLLHIVANPTNLAHALQVIFGCNPLDVVQHQDAAPAGSAVNALDPAGATLAGFGNGGAGGTLLVVLDATTPATAGWVWTGPP